MKLVNELPGNDRVVNTEIYDVSGCEARRLENHSGSIEWVLTPHTKKRSFRPMDSLVQQLEKERTKLKSNESDNNTKN